MIRPSLEKYTCFPRLWRSMELQRSTSQATIRLSMQQQILCILAFITPFPLKVEWSIVSHHNPQALPCARDNQHIQGNSRLCFSTKDRSTTAIWLSLIGCGLGTGSKAAPETHPFSCRLLEIIHEIVNLTSVLCDLTWNLGWRNYVLRGSRQY